MTPNSATLALGVENALNTYPEANSYAPLTVGNRYGQFSPFGFNGAYYYGRLTYRWGLSAEGDSMFARARILAPWPSGYRPVPTIEPATATTRESRRTNT
ncbi:MAG: hypothetical protein F4018_20255 [Acidobacteria bacterium]|nr:hypothetical protein [Acidobacteriota bacterium]MYK90490.1 hypothetical protein [Acidobacteriota bacterium]